MFRVLIWKEIRGHLMTFRFAAALVTISLLIVSSVWMLGEDYLRRFNSYVQASDAAANLEKEYVVPSEINPTLLLPPSPLSMFSRGEAGRFGNSITIRRWEVPRETTGNYGTGLMTTAQAPFDFYTVIAAVVSLFAILLTYDGISGERETGLLKMQSTCGTGRASLFLSKFAGAVICLAIPILLGMVAGLLVLIFILNIGFSSGQWLAIALIGFASMLYGTLFAALGLACSAVVRWSAASVVLALLCWAMLVIVLPSLSQSTAAAIRPLDSQFALNSLERHTMAEAQRTREELASRYPDHEYGYWTSSFSTKSERFFKYDCRAAGFRDAEQFIRGLEPVMQARADTVWRAYNAADQREREQALLEEQLAFISPARHLRDALSSLTYTSYSQYADFIEAARRFRAEMLDNFRRKGYFGDNVLKFFSQRDPEDIDDEKYRARVDYYRSQLALGKNYGQFMGPKFLAPVSASDIPEFDFRYFRLTAEPVVIPLGVLAVEAALLLLAGLVAFQRYDIR
jgi:ABC-type transport system involved in multi-copper enzyme maturation permease subunit